MTTPSVLIDCDTGIDDAVALIYLAALHREGLIDLRAVTTTAGNVDARQTAINTRYVLDLCGLPDIPVAAGEARPLVVDLVTTPETHGPTGLGYVTAPKDVDKRVRTDWQALWETHLGDETRLIVTGPATNLASYARGHRFPASVTLMGGAYLYPGNTTPTAEWNSWVDPHAAKGAFAAATSPITVCSLGVTEQMLIDPARLATLVDALGGAPVAAILPRALRFYFEFHEAQGEGYQAQIHDLLTCMIALGRVDYEATATTVDVECDSPLLRGTTVADLRGYWARPANARLVTAVDIDGAHEELLRAWATLAP